MATQPEQVARGQAERLKHLVTPEAAPQSSMSIELHSSRRARHHTLLSGRKAGGGGRLCVDAERGVQPSGLRSETEQRAPVCWKQA